MPTEDFGWNDPNFFNDLQNIHRIDPGFVGGAFIGRAQFWNGSYYKILDNNRLAAQQNRSYVLCAQDMTKENISHLIVALKATNTSSGFNPNDALDFDRVFAFGDMDDAVLTTLANGEEAEDGGVEVILLVGADFGDRSQADIDRLKQNNVQVKRIQPMTGRELNNALTDLFNNVPTNGIVDL